MSTDPQELIQQAEDEMGYRWDDPNNNNALALLFGRMSRIARDAGIESPTPRSYKPNDDFVAGKMLLHQMSPEGQRGQTTRELLANMLRAGLSPDDVASFFGRR